VDMDRRSFLKTLGLGAVALTIPKPLDIIAAKMADLERPPLHVGYAKTMPAKDCGDRGFFLLQSIGVRVERGLSASRYCDYMENWYTSVFLHKEGDKTRGIKYLQMPTSRMPNPEKDKWTTIGEDCKPHQIPAMLSSPRAYLLKPDDVLEFWFAPHSALSPTEPPNYLLPKLDVVLYGTRHYAEPKVYIPQDGRQYTVKRVPRTRAIAYWHLCDVRNVMLDRARAIELGLVSQDSELYLG